MKVSVIGLGYVGAVTASCLARDGHDVLGIDIDSTKLDLLASGSAPIIEDGLQEVTEEAAASGRLSLTDGVDERLAGQDIVFICVGTPSAANGSQDATAVERVAQQVGEAISGSTVYPVVVVRSTVHPGITESRVLPILERHSGLRVGDGFGLCFQPEFLREGSSVKDFYAPPFTIVGGDSDRSINVVRTLFDPIDADFIATAIPNAEMLKMACNAFHALKISFANEIGRLGQSLGLDGRDVMQLLCRDKSLNISSAYLRPGYAYGGSCLPKDLRALLHIAKMRDVEVPLLAGTLATNDIHIEHAAEMVKSAGSRKIGLLGLSFKPGTDDLRESPLVALAEHLIGKGYELTIYDPAVNVALLIGANRRFIDETIPHIEGLLTDSLDDLLSSVETLVIGHPDPSLRDALQAAQCGVQHIVDLVGVDIGAGRGSSYKGVCW